MYSNKLISEVRELYPDNPSTIKAAEEGNFLLGFLLDIGNKSILYSEILEATSLEELQEKAMLIKRKIEVYKLWLSEDPRHKSNTLI